MYFRKRFHWAPIYIFAFYRFRVLYSNWLERENNFGDAVSGITQHTIYYYSTSWIHMLTRSKYSNLKTSQALRILKGECQDCKMAMVEWCWVFLTFCIKNYHLQMAECASYTVQLYLEFSARLFRSTQHVDKSINCDLLARTRWFVLIKYENLTKNSNLFKNSQKSACQHWHTLSEKKCSFVAYLDVQTWYYSFWDFMQYCPHISQIVLY